MLAPFHPHVKNAVGSSGGVPVGTCGDAIDQQWGWGHFTDQS
jgi:hypothetical protein